jgi:hypothetical protein
MVPEPILTIKQNPSLHYMHSPWISDFKNNALQFHSQPIQRFGCRLILQRAERLADMR